MRQELVKIDKLLNDATRQLTALEQLQDTALRLRGVLLTNAVLNIERDTNATLEKFFDGEIKVEFQLSADKLEVTLQKNGYECSFRQLSGGQRCMLKLAFATSLMKAAANKAGIHFDTLFFDEPLAGLDEELKVKAFGMFEALEKEHGSVFVIDHAPEFKSLFSNQYQVSLNGDTSEITSEKP